MTESSLNDFTRKNVGILKYLNSGLIAGLISAVLNNVLYIALIVAGGYDWVLVVAVSVLVASLLPNILASIAYFLLTQLTQKAWRILAIGVVVFVLFSGWCWQLSGKTKRVARSKPWAM